MICVYSAGRTGKNVKIFYIINKRRQAMRIKITNLFIIGILIMSINAYAQEEKYQYKVRQMGDDILESAVPLAELKDTDKIKNDIDIMSTNQKIYGGIGISSNQCADIANPTRIAIIGSNDPQLREKIQIRYPHEVIPYETVVINPVIVNYGKEIYFPEDGEGCLSVQGKIRGKVQRYREIEVKYNDIHGQLIQKVVSGIEAHVFQHEIDHLNGITYLQKIFHDCTSEQNKTIKNLVEKEIGLDHRQADHINVFIKDNPITFDRRDKQVVFEEDIVRNDLKSTPTITLLGIKKALEKI